MDQFSLKGKTVIAIGGSKGLGKGMAEGLALAGADVVISSRKQAELDKTAAELSAATKGSVVGIAADVSTKAGVDGLVAAVEERFGHIDILINGAGLNIRKSILDCTEEDWDAVQNVQIKSVFLMSQAVAHHMIKNQIHGKIINVASLTSQLGLKNMISYCCAKGAVVQLTKAMANELAEYGINVNAIGPGYYETEMTKPLFEVPEKRAELFARIPMKRFGLPQDLAGAATFLASPASDYVTGQVIYVDGGWLAC